MWDVRGQAADFVSRNAFIGPGLGFVVNPLAMWLRTVALATTLAVLTAPDAGAATKRPAATSASKKTKSSKVEAPPTPALEEPPKLEPVAATPASGPPTLSTKYRAVAILPLGAEGIGESTERSVEQALINEIEDKSGFRAVSPRDVVSEAATSNLNPAMCASEDMACFAQVARYARAHLAIVTRIAAFGGVVNVSMRLLDTQTGSEVGRVADALSDKADERAAQLHRMSVQLFTPAEYVGTLIVKSDEAGADIYLNDKLVGTTPLKAPLKNLPAGPYILHVTKEGFADVYQFVDVAYNRVATITVSLATNTIAGNIAFGSDTGFGQVYVIAEQPGVEVRIDGEPKGMTPLEGAISSVAAGTRRLSLRKGNAPPLVRELTVEKDKRTDVGVLVKPDGTLEAVVVTSPVGSPLPVDPGLSTPIPGITQAAPAKRSHPVFTTGLVVAGLGVATLGVGGIFASQVRSANNQANDYERTIRESDDAAERNDARVKLQELNDEGPGKERRQWIALGVGGGLLVTGGLLMAADHWHWFGVGTSGTAMRLDEGWTVGVMPGPGGGMVSLVTPW